MNLVPENGSIVGWRCTEADGCLQAVLSHGGKWEASSAAIIYTQYTSLRYLSLYLLGI